MLLESLRGMYFKLQRIYILGRYTKNGNKIKPAVVNKMHYFFLNIVSHILKQTRPLAIHMYLKTRMWADVQRDGRPAEHRWCPLLNVAKFGTLADAFYSNAVQ